MKEHQKTGWKAVTVLLASAAFGSAQVNRVSTPAVQSNSSPNYTYQAPSPNSHIVSARVAVPGTINYVEGEASLDGRALSRNSAGPANLLINQTLTTGNGYVELLLTPGAFFRVGHDSEVSLDSSGLAKTRVRLLRGSAILEVDQLIKGTELTVLVDGVAAHIEKKGLYDFNASGHAINVLDGKTSVQDGDRTQSIGKNDGVVLNAGPIKRHNINDKPIKASELYIWSKARSQDESEANFAAANNPSYYPVAGPGWFWNSYAGAYGFWPVDSFLYSPFGWGFYSPAYFGFYGGYPGYGFYGRRAFYARPAFAGRGYVGGVRASVRSGFIGGGFHGGHR